MDFAEALSGKEDRRYRLPSEAEWERACRAGAVSRFHHGNDPRRLSDYAWHRGIKPRRIRKVKQKLPNEWDLYDMLGFEFEKEAIHRTFGKEGDIVNA